MDVVALSHLDVGFTDLPSNVRDLQRRYVDVAVDLCVTTRVLKDDRKYHWTVESQLPLWDWWQSASPSRREALSRCVKDGQIDVGAFAFNQQPFLSESDWKTMSHWVPGEVWNQLAPKVGIQDDVNGIPREGALQLLDRHIDLLWMGMNTDGGGPPFSAPAPFWWRMPDGRRVFTYLAGGYYEGQLDLEGEQVWRRGPTPRSYDLQFHPPGEGDVLDTSLPSLLIIQKHLLKVLKKAEDHGYSASRYIISFSNQWRFDNDPPNPDLPRFIAAWNKAGLKPTLRFTTVSDAMSRLRQEYGAHAPEYSGEWPDWWADGNPSDPRVVSAGREAARTIAAATSPVWKGASPKFEQDITELKRKLALFSEHTWGSSWSIAFPHGFDSEAQYAEKVLLAYQPLEQSKWLLSQQARWTLRANDADVSVVNTGDLPWSGWVDLQAEALRTSAHSVKDASTGRSTALEFSPGIRVKWPEKSGQVSAHDDYGVFPDRYPESNARFWVEGLAPHSVRKFSLMEAKADPPEPLHQPPTVLVNEHDWPVSATWGGPNVELFSGDLGSFESISIEGSNPRESAVKMADARTGTELEKLRESLRKTAASETSMTTREDNGHTLVFRQTLHHPRLRWIERELEIWKDEPRARLTVRISRLPSEQPEAFFVTMELPAQAQGPTLTVGGEPFRPYVDQIPGTCMDYFAFDGWARYAGQGGEWLVLSRDAPVISFGEPELFPHLTSAPKQTNRVSSMVFNNTWYVNWVADPVGEMTFQYDLLWRNDLSVPASRVAAGIWMSPTTVLRSGKQDGILMNDLFRP